jgi:hypothetical protein
MEGLGCCCLVLDITSPCEEDGSDSSWVCRGLRALLILDHMSGKAEALLSKEF